MTYEDRYNKVFAHPEFVRLLDEIENLEQARIYCKHDLSHLLDVARIAYIKVLESRLDISKDIVYAASLLHDIGRVSEYRTGENHDEAGARIAEKILEDSGYEGDEIMMITIAIREHGGEGVSLLGRVLHEADHESRICVRCRAKDSCKWKVKNGGISL